MFAMENLGVDLPIPPILLEITNHQILIRPKHRMPTHARLGQDLHPVPQPCRFQDRRVSLDGHEGLEVAAEERKGDYATVEGVD